MSYIIDETENGQNWRYFFDYIMVEAHKPAFFDEGTTLKEINIVSFKLFVFSKNNMI